MKKVLSNLIFIFSVVILVDLCLAPLLNDLDSVFFEICNLFNKEIESSFFMYLKEEIENLNISILSFFIDAESNLNPTRIINMLSFGTYDTIYMSILSLIIAIVFGLPMGVLLHITKKNGISQKPLFYAFLSSITNALRSFPFIVLIVLLLPLSKFLIGSMIGPSAAVVPLGIAAIPFIARLFENALDEVDSGLVEAALSMGASKFKIIKMLINEAKPGINNAITITLISLIGYSAMAGALGAGGLGDLAIRIGFLSNEVEILYSCVFIIILIVQVFQTIGDYLTAKARKNI